MHHRFFCLLGLIVSTSQIHAEEIANWLSWRGAAATGSVAQGNFPGSLGSDSLRWQAELPGKGTSTPIVLNQQIFVTAPVQDVDAVLSFDANGKLLWTTQFGQEDKGKHRNGSGSNSSPVTDGKLIYVYFKSGTFAAVDPKGKIQWQQNIVEQFGKEKMFWDYGSSPVVTEKYVVLVRMHEGESWLAAFDKSDGKLVWKVDRTYQVPTEVDQCYTTPLVIQHNGVESLLTWGADHITIHQAADGKLVWSCGGFNPEGNRLWPAIASPVISKDHVVVAFGRNDRGTPLLYGVRLNGNGDVTASNHSWSRKDVGTFVPSPCIYDGNVIVVGDQGELESLDPVTGKTIWKENLPKSRSKFYASPLVAGGRLYAVREDGVAYVGSITDGKFKLESEHDFKQPIIGSPVPFGSSILLRGESHLFCIGK